MKLALGGSLLLLSFIVTASGKPDLYGSLLNHANDMCKAVSDVARYGRYSIPQIERVFFELRTPCKRTQYRVAEAENLRNSPDFDVNKKTEIFVGGWNSNMNAAYTEEMTNAYNCRNEHNFIVINTADYVKGPYIKSAYNTQELGKFIAYGLKKLNVPGKNIHLIGHSLGAHIMGSVGRHYKEETGDTIARITGLDPARPCFISAPAPVFSRLNTKDATFVDIIHSNSNQAGTAEAIGHVDFYPGGLNSTQPSCKLTDIQCSHAMSIKYYTESVYKGNEDNFIGHQCQQGRRVDVQTCTYGTGVSMGYSAKAKVRGVFTMPVGKAAPYGRNARRRKVKTPEICGLCKIQ